MTCLKFHHFTSQDFQYHLLLLSGHYLMLTRENTIDYPLFPNANGSFYENAFFGFPHEFMAEGLLRDAALRECR